MNAGLCEGGNESPGSLKASKECSGSPKRRLHRNIQQDSKTELVKRTTVTKTTISERTTTASVNGAADPNCNNQISGKVILPVVLYDREIWTLTLREEHRLRVFENKVHRKISAAKRDEVTGEWRKLHNTELHALYPSPDIIRNIKSRRLRWAGHVARVNESRNAYRVLVGRLKGKIPLERPRCRWEDNFKMDLREVGYDDRDWINLAQDRDRWRAFAIVELYFLSYGVGRQNGPSLRHVKEEQYQERFNKAAPNDTTMLAVVEKFRRSGSKKEHLLRTSGERTKEETSEVLCVECSIVWGRKWTLRRSEEERIEAFEMWIWRRMERVKWTDRIRNEAVLERVDEEIMMLKLIKRN
ncbi:hypothetical protein ANN_05984 [Periplaneta americana]|uniref:Uncharacterized protein n=1 Tax=Periplaneta americana TaxID=6978 RepID=A0ABQ8TCB0_PERAM|nr:hypothetical protein ANN_05984 [Periplaneta americana]